jgi:hypothetical protein
MAKRSPLGSHEKSVTVSVADVIKKKKKEGDITKTYHTFELNDFYREVLLADAENLEVAENGFFGLCVAINTHTEKVALILPIQSTLKGGSGPMS